MKLFFIISFLSASLSAAGFDTARVFTLPIQVVTGTKTMMPVEKLSSTVQVIDSADLSAMNGISIADKLKNTGGITLRSYGGKGALQSVSVRGMGSDYSLILVDGRRFTTYQISTVDLGIFSSNEIDRIEIASGGNSSLYGADAVGGVVNIITKKPDGRSYASASSTIGSDGLSGYRVSAGGGTAGLSVRLSTERQRASNEFDFHHDDGVTQRTLQRSGADYRLDYHSLAVRSILTDRLYSDVSVRYSEADRGQPAAVSGALQNNHARIHDADLLLSAVVEHSVDELLTYSFPVSYHRNRQQYRDPALIIGGVPLSANYNNRIVSVSPEIRFTLSPNHAVAAGSEYSTASITSNELFSSERRQFSGSLSSRHRFHFPFDMIFFPSIRFDSFSDVQGDLSPKIGINVGILDKPTVRFRASYGKNYRVPTFNDLYWIDGGNPNLLPERSINSDAGFIGEYISDEFHIKSEINVFSIQAENKIVWQPGTGAIWTPKNLQSVRSTGVEFHAAVSGWDGLAAVTYHHTITESKKTSADFPNDPSYNKLLPYVPQQLTTVGIGSSFSNISINALYTLTGYRFETADNNPRFILPTVSTVDANASYIMTMPFGSFRIKAEVNNMTNVPHTLITGYPMPLRNYLFTTEILF